MPAVPPYIIEPIWEQFCALLPERNVDHPLGCHRARIPDRVVFEKLLQVLVFGCAYWRISEKGCSAHNPTPPTGRMDRGRGDGGSGGDRPRSLRPDRRFGA